MINYEGFFFNSSAAANFCIYSLNCYCICGCIDHIFFYVKYIVRIINFSIYIPSNKGPSRFNMIWSCCHLDRRLRRVSVAIGKLLICSALNSYCVIPTMFIGIKDNLDCFWISPLSNNLYIISNMTKWENITK